MRNKSGLRKCGINLKREFSCAGVHLMAQPLPREITGPEGIRRLRRRKAHAARISTRMSKGEPQDRQIKEWGAHAGAPSLKRTGLSRTSSRESR
jgi:hypothetical protein